MDLRCRVWGLGCRVQGLVVKPWCVLGVKPPPSHGHAMLAVRGRQLSGVKNDDSYYGGGGGVRTRSAGAHIAPLFTDL